MQMSGFRSRVKLCKFESGNLAITKPATKLSSGATPRPGNRKTIKRGPEIGCCRRSYRDGAPVNPANFFFRGTFQFSVFPWRPFLPFTGQPLSRFFFNFHQNITYSSRRKHRGQNFVIATCLTILVETIVDSDQVSLAIAFLIFYLPR